MRGLDLHHHLAGATFVSAATARGKLYKIDAYPGMVEGDGIVHGELYSSDDPAVVLEVLDEVEGYDPLDYADTSEYVRVKRDVRTDDGRVVPAWLYLYNRTITGYEMVKSGDWRTAKSS
jgi:gamma-glutamylcyclotransferase (GGCT)/AIG2-like uncharacterized protein YtfP